MPISGYTVYVVDDDPAVRDALGLLLSVRGYPVALFSDAARLLETLRPDWCGCLLIDIRMPGMDGLELQRRLVELGCRMPVIIMTGHGDVTSAREAFRAHAVDFLEKPIDDQKLFAAVDEAFAFQATAMAGEKQRSDFEQRLKRLTPREEEVMKLVIVGQHNREIAATLGISSRTVEVHKARMMEKLQVDSVPQLVRISLGAHDIA